MAQDISFDIIARDKASKTFDSISKRSGQTGARLAKFGKIAALSLGSAGVAVGALGVKFAKQAIQDQASSAMLAKALKNNANATKGQVAATEKWISAQGTAFGVADDDLRPALARLAAATHSVRKAQSLASLAMNISAGTGKNLQTVTQALAKAQLGQMGGLGRLGVQIKDAKGKTLSLEAVTAKLAHTYRGQAATAADTTAGRFARFKLTISETTEAIGYHLLPIASALAGWLLNTGVPAFEKFSAKVSMTADTISKAFARLNVREALTSVVAFFDRTKSGAGEAGGVFVQFKATVASMAANLSSIFSSIISIAHSFWAEYGDLITKYGINTLKNLLTSLRGAMNIIAGLFKVVAAVMKGDWSGAWKGIKQIALGAMQLIRGSVGQFLNQLKALFAAGARTLGVLMRAAWDGVVNAVRSGISHAVALIKSLPGKMLKAVGNLDKLLYNAGKAVISGLIQGIGDKVGDLVGKLKSVTNLIPKHKGPIDKDRALLRPAGVAIMDGLIAGIEGQKMKLATAMEKITNLIAKARDRIASLKQTRADFKSTFSADSIFGADLETSGNSLAGLLDFQKQQAAKARQLAADVARVTQLGLSGSLIKQLQSAGSSGEDQLHLLAGASAAQIRQFNALNAQTQSSLSAAGLQAGNYARGGSIDADIKRAQKQERVLEAILKYLARQHGEDVVVKIGPDAIIRIIRKHAKDRGVSVASLLGI